jgi:voltage-gated potassium channel Kch
MRKVTFGDRARYRFDNIMARGTGALVAGLGVLSGFIIIVATVVVFALGEQPELDGGEPMGFVHVMWMAFLRTLDPGTMGGDDGSYFFLGAMLFVTMGGIFVVSAFIGILTSGLESKLDELRKGRSFVVEKDHTLILGWSSQVFTILSELVIANESRKDAVVVILSETDKVEMEDEIAVKVPDLKTTRVICRTGNPIDTSDLELVNPQEARSVIVLAPPEVKAPDTHVIKTILALTGDRTRTNKYHIVAEIRAAKNLVPARMVGRDEAEFVLFSELISRITVQTCRQSGLSVVYTELLDFDGDEIYFGDSGALVGKTFGEALFAFEESALIGLRKGSGAILLNPPSETPIEPGDKVIAISKDDDTVKPLTRPTPPVDEAAIQAPVPFRAHPERSLILGWNTRGRSIISELENYVAIGSSIVVVADHEGVESEIAELQGSLSKQKVKVIKADSADREILDSLDVCSFEHIITLSLEDLDLQDADAKTLMTLLHLRDIVDGTPGRGRPSIVSEMIDAQNRRLAEVTKADDFIVSDRLVSLALSQISENKELSKVFAELFAAEGAEVYLRPAGAYVELGKPMDFYTVLEAARRRKEVAIGYRVAAKATDASAAYGVVVNPNKANRITFSSEDKIVVLADE